MFHVLRSAKRGGLVALPSVAETAMPTDEIFGLALSEVPKNQQAKLRKRPLTGGYVTITVEGAQVSGATIKPLQASAELTRLRKHLKR